MKIWKPQSKNQELFHSVNCDEIFFGGAAGGGKTDALMREALRQITNPNYRAILFRRTFPEIETSFIDKAYSWYQAAGLKPTNGGKLWEYPGGGKIRFAHLQHETDVHKHQSAEYTVIGFDELTSFTEFQYNYLISRCRTPDKSLKKYIMSASNPGNIGHGWVKRRFIDGVVPNKIYLDKKTNLARIFIPAKVYDNPVLMDNDPEYVRRLESLPENQRKALLDGNWDVFEGQFFTAWDKDIHTIEPYQLNPLFKKFICYDYGFYAPTAVYWGAVDFWNRIIFYKELYKTGLTYEQLGMEIARITGTDKIDWIVHPKDMYRTSEETGVIGLELLRKGLYSNPISEKIFKKIRHIQCNDTRIPGWNIMRDYIKPALMPDGKQGARVVWFNICVNAARTIPELIHDDIHPEDLNSDSEDHCLSGETLIDTNKGQIMIKDLIGKTGKVWTLKGLKIFDRVAQTKWNTKLYKLYLENGKYIIATSEHQVLTQRGWVELQKLDIRFDGVIQLDICITSSQKQYSVIRIVKLKHYGRGDAYNLRVPNIKHFSINGGLIVHNSADACRYGLTSLKIPKSQPKNEKEEEKINIQKLNNQWHTRRKKEAKSKYARQKNRKFI